MPAMIGYNFTICIPKAASDRTRLFKSRQGEREIEKQRKIQERTYGIMFAIRGYGFYMHVHVHNSVYLVVLQSTFTAASD